MPGREPIDNDGRRIRDLELALRHERDRSRALERRAAAYEEALRRSYKFQLASPRPRED